MKTIKLYFVASSRNGEFGEMLDGPFASAETAKNMVDCFDPLGTAVCITVPVVEVEALL